MGCQADQGLALAKAQLKGTDATPSPEDRDTLISISNIDSRLHRSADAQAMLDKADALFTKPDEHRYIDYLRAAIYDHDKQYDQAEAEYRKALAISPRSEMEFLPRWNFPHGSPRFRTPPPCRAAGPSRRGWRCSSPIVRRPRARPVAASASGERVQVPLAGDSLELCATSLLELKAGASDEILDGA